jgi:hypothetical protein
MLYFPRSCHDESAIPEPEPVRRLGGRARRRRRRRGAPVDTRRQRRRSSRRGRGKQGPPRESWNSHRRRLQKRGGTFETARTHRRMVTASGWRTALRSSPHPHPEERREAARLEGCSSARDRSCAIERPSTPPDQSPGVRTRCGGAARQLRKMVTAKPDTTYSATSS